MKRALITAAGAAVLVIGGQGQASASSDIFVSYGAGSEGFWTADPYRDLTGDTVMACDSNKDGWGVQAELDINPNPLNPGAFSADRIASTRGHDSPYCDKESGNLKEDTPVALRVCLVKGSEKKCTLPKYGSA
ncbi:hypothetical protein [Streptomyces sp. Caat 7-52]|uniref:hypothetical protein n=1 Tax=Streptomyces sp. Caat 7-52 TaxID=2949637 RepID=UPI002035C00D|nr:hypothetical protein [Streptomyces sp. Caat 7-52]